MAEKLFEVSLPEEVIAGFGWEDAEVPDKLREALVMELLRRDDITEAQAAALLHLDRWNLLETMRRYQVSAIRMSPAELKRELTQDIQLD
jgi:hypothetical protein